MTIAVDLGRKATKKQISAVRTRGLNIGLGFHHHPYFVYACSNALVTRFSLRICIDSHETFVS